MVPNRYTNGVLRTCAGDAKRTGAAPKYGASLASLQKGASHAGQGVARRTTDRSEQQSKDSSDRPLFHPLRWRGAVLIELALLIEWLALAAVIGLLLWGTR